MKKSGYTPFKMKGKSPMMKKLIGNQHRLPEELKAKILASPTKMMKKSPTKKVERPDAKSKKINPFSAEYKKMTRSQREKKYGFKTTKEGIEKKKIIGSGKKGTLREGLKGLNKKIQEKAASLDRFIKGKTGATPSSSNSNTNESAKGTTRSRFNAAFAAARKAKKSTFSFEGKEYSTDLAPTKMKKSAMKLKKKSPAKMMKKSPSKMAKKSPAKKYKSDAQRKAVHASKADGGKGAPAKMMKKSAAKMMKKSPTKLIKKKTDREKLNKLVEKRTKLNKKKDEREAKGKKTKKVTRRIEKTQKKINKNPKAQEDLKKNRKKKNVEQMMTNQTEKMMDFLMKEPVRKMKRERGEPKKEHLRPQKRRTSKR